MPARSDNQRRALLAASLGTLGSRKSKQRRVFWIEAVQKIGDEYYPRMYAFKTRGEADKCETRLKSDESYSCVVMYGGKMEFPVVPKPRPPCRRYPSGIQLGGIGIIYTDSHGDVWTRPIGSGHWVQYAAR